MFKKITVALLFLCLSASSWAYLIESKLIVENKTNMSMKIAVEQSNGQSLKEAPFIPAWSTTEFHLNNGDSSGLLYQTATATFTISRYNFNDKDAKNYIEGRVAFYVGAGGYYSKYSFLDSLSAAEGINMDTSYVCSASTSPFENKIVITGTPGENGLQFKTPADYPAKVNCQRFKSSTLGDNHQSYTPVCIDGKSDTFWKTYELYSAGEGFNILYGKVQGSPQESPFCSWWVAGYCGSSIDNKLPGLGITDAVIKNALDNSRAVRKFCDSW